MSEPFLGEIRMGGWNFAPQGWAFCSGQALSISQNDALFALIGTTYGGDGVQTFNLPDMRGRVPVHQGNGFIIGELTGSENVTLTVQTIPSHTHGLTVSSANGSSTTPAGELLATAPVGLGNVYGAADGTGTLANSTAATGQSQPHDNMMPFLGINFIIALQGIFPSQN